MGRPDRLGVRAEPKGRFDRAAGSFGAHALRAGRCGASDAPVCWGASAFLGPGEAFGSRGNDDRLLKPADDRLRVAADPLVGAYANSIPS